MATASGNEGYIELYDVATKQAVAKAPLAQVRFIPRIGERVFIAVEGPGDWHSYTVVTVEYFLGYEGATKRPSRSLERGLGRVTLYVESSK